MKQFNSLLFSLVLIISMVVPIATHAAESFKDVSTDHRFYEEMMYLENQEVISGFPDGTFRPNDKVTRGAAAIMIGRALGLRETQKSSGFKDVNQDSAASGYIAAAVEEGIISGFPDNSYRPDDTVTRGQMAIFLSRAFNLTTESTVSFPDVLQGQVAYKHIKRIMYAGITTGYPDGTYRPNEVVTRSSFSAFLARALNDQFKTVDNSKLLLPCENAIMTGELKEWCLSVREYSENEVFPELSYDDLYSRSIFVDPENKFEYDVRYNSTRKKTVTERDTLIQNWIANKHVEFLTKSDTEVKLIAYHPQQERIVKYVESKWSDEEQNHYINEIDVSSPQVVDIDFISLEPRNQILSSSEIQHIKNILIEKADNLLTFNLQDEELKSVHYSVTDQVLNDNWKLKSFWGDSKNYTIINSDNRRDSLQINTDSIVFTTHQKARNYLEDTYINKDSASGNAIQLESYSKNNFEYKLYKLSNANNYTNKDIYTMYLISENIAKDGYFRIHSMSFISNTDVGLFDSEKEKEIIAKVKAYTDLYTNDVKQVYQY